VIRAIAAWSPALRVVALCLLAAPAACTSDSDSESALQLRRWKGGVALQTRTEPPVTAYLWFYEWNLFDAFERGENTRGRVGWDWKRSPDGSRMEMTSDDLSLTATAAADGADLRMTVTNRSGHDWPAIAAMIPCLSPGLEEVREEIFTDEERERTWFLGAGGLEKLTNRDIHFNGACRAELDAWEPQGEDGRFAFADRWTASDRDAARGLMVRESSDGEWVMGIGWEDFVSAQGHNPMRCLHLSARVGPLARGESRTLHGKVYLFRGTRDDCLERFRRDFPERSGT
jgi:hypothetical protein